MAEFRIGELAQRFNVPVETIRFYEHAGLIPKPTRTAGNYRLYSEAQAVQLGFVLNCRMLDMSQEEIKTLLSLRSNPSRNCGDVNALFDRHINEVTGKIAGLKQLLTELQSLRRSCTDGRETRDCSILSTLQRSNLKKRNNKPRDRRSSKPSSTFTRE